MSGKEPSPPIFPTTFKGRPLYPKVTIHQPMFSGYLINLGETPLQVEEQIAHLLAVPPQQRHLQTEI